MSGEGPPPEDALSRSQGPAEGPPRPGPEASGTEGSSAPPVRHPSAPRRRRSLLAPSASASSGTLGRSPNPYAGLAASARASTDKSTHISQEGPVPGAFPGAGLIMTLSFSNLDVAPSGSAHPAGEVGTQEDMGDTMQENGPMCSPCSPVQHSAGEVRSSVRRVTR